MLCGISGPLATGKTTLVSILESSLPIDTIIIHDLHDKVFGDLVASELFTEFYEVSKDRDYLLIYISRLVTYYTEMIEAYKDYPGLVLFDGTHIDLMIYSMLNLWYHYPTSGYQESIMHKLLESSKSLDVIYMTNADDENYPITKLGSRRYCTAFKRHRLTELYYYDIFRDNSRVVSLPDKSVMNCDRFILDDLKSRSLIC